MNEKCHEYSFGIRHKNYDSLPLDVPGPGRYEIKTSLTSKRCSIGEKYKLPSSRQEVPSVGSYEINKKITDRVSFSRKGTLSRSDKN